MKTAEAVTSKHPDKMCDQISDAILDWCLERDPMARVAIEVMGGHGHVYITGELTMKEQDSNVFHEAIDAIAYRIIGMDLNVHINIQRQSHEIANGVDTGGAGDQGIMIGYACSDNEAMIPQEAWLARNLAQSIYSNHPYDGKTQITLKEDGEIETIVASFQNVPKQKLYDEVIHWMDTNNEPAPKVLPKIYVNPAGDWNQGGFDADTGLTGRKLMVDNYGPQIPIGGGCFSGKDATKVDRSAAYMARYLAVFTLKSMGAQEVIVKLAYAIGKADPVMVTAIADGKEVTRGLLEGYEQYLTPQGMIDYLDLRRPQFEKTAQWGHFGNGFSWDK